MDLGGDAMDQDTIALTKLKEEDVQNAAREHSADAIKTLSDIINNPKEPAAARISAACALLDRGYGKPLQTVDANNTNVNYVVSDQPMTEEEWAAERVTEH
jgi:hypothetical protein